MAISFLFGGPKWVEHENQNMDFLTFTNLEHEIYDIGTEILLLKNEFSFFWLVNRVFEKGFVNLF